MLTARAAVLRQLRGPFQIILWATTSLTPAITEDVIACTSTTIPLNSEII